MLDSLFTLTKGGAMWMAILFAVSVLMTFGITALTGNQEPLFALLALFILATFVVTGIYTLGKLIVHKVRGPGPADSAQ